MTIDLTRLRPAIVTTAINNITSGYTYCCNAFHAALNYSGRHEVATEEYTAAFKDFVKKQNSGKLPYWWSRERPYKRARIAALTAFKEALERAVDRQAKPIRQPRVGEVWCSNLHTSDRKPVRFVITAIDNSRLYGIETTLYESCGEGGVFFYDVANDFNSTPYVNSVFATSVEEKCITFTKSLRFDHTDPTCPVFLTYRSKKALNV